MKQNSKAADITASMLGALLTAWLAVLIAPYVQQGMIGIIKSLGTAVSDPLKLTWCEDSLKTILVFLLVYSLVIAMVFANRKNYRRGEEQGSARWGEVAAINKKYAQNPAANNRLLTQHVRMGLDDHKHMRNLNVMVVGGSGAGKTRYYCLPNLLQCPECSFVILDPKGEILRATGNLLIQKGYELKVLDLISMERSHCYNPLMYVRNDEEAQKLVTNLFKSTTPKDTKSSDPFWENMAQNLLMALVFLLLYEAPEEEQNFAMVMDLLRAGAIEDEEHPVPTALDRIFAELRTRKPDHMAVKFYDSYHVGAAKTLASIQVTLASHLDKFNLDSMAKLTITDEMELNTLGERKTALFAIIPDSDTSFNFLISMLYTQLFQKLKDEADFVHGGRLPIPVHFLMDEFANVALPTDFEKDLATIRSRGISVSIILQNMAQLRALFDKQWESVAGNCDTFLYLGGNEQSTHKYISELLGKETIDVNSYGRTRGQSPSYSTQYNFNGRDLLDPSEVRLLDNRNAILLIRGEKPVIDAKYDLMHHPNIELSAFGKGDPYIHGKPAEADAAIEVSFEEITEKKEEKEDTDYELYTGDELQEKLKEREGEHNEQQKK